VDALSKAQGLGKERALALLVEAEAVAQEAKRNSFPEAGKLDRVALAKRYLETVYSAETLCGNIGDAEVRSFYEITYAPDWPVDIYKGLTLEVRCCPNTVTPCDTDEVRSCMEDNRAVLDELAAIGEKWTTDVLPDIASLKSRYPLLNATDFGFLVWPGIPLEEQKRKKLFDPETLRSVIALAPGQVSLPVESPLGFHLFRLTQFRPAINPDSPELVASARTAICSERVGRTRDRYVRTLLESAVVEVNQTGSR